MSPSCCGIRGLRRLRIGNIEVGLTDVDATMEFLYVEGWSPEDEHLGKTFVQQLRKAGNYIPPDQEPLYAPALIELFRDFYKANAAGGADSRTDGRL